MSAKVDVNGQEIVIRVQIDASSAGAHAPDRLVRLNATDCEREGFELLGLQAKVRSGELPVVKIGRASFVRMSDILALATPRPSVAKTSAFDDSINKALAAPRRRRGHAA